MLLRQKYEEMANSLLESVQRAGGLIRAQNLEEIHTLSHDAGANKCHLLCQLYFPELVPFALQYMEANVAVFHALVLTYHTHDQRTLGAQAVGSESFEKAKATFVEARGKFFDAIQINATI